MFLRRQVYKIGLLERLMRPLLKCYRGICIAVYRRRVQNMEYKDIGIRALDMQTGLYKYSDSVLDLKISETMLIGKAASLASHLRGIQVVEDFDALKVLASKLGITSTELISVLEILQEVELVRVIGSSRKPEKIEVLITAFEDAYQLLGEKWQNDKPDEFERKVVQLINDLAGKSIKLSKILSDYDLKTDDYNIILNIGKAGGFLDTYKPDGEDIVYSPIYMEENAEQVLEMLNKYNDDDVQKALKLLNSKPGYPVKDLNDIENNVLIGLMSSNIFQTPAITASGGRVNFIFTPYTEVEDKEMLRQARNVVAAVRYGEQFSAYSELRNPSLFLQKLLDRGYIGKTPHSDIEAQYGVLRDNGLGRIEEVGENSGRYRFILADTDYAKTVIKLAKKLMVSNNTFDPSLERGIIKEAWEDRKYLTSYELSEYIPNLSNLKQIRGCLSEKREITDDILTKRKVNEALNKLFISGGEPDVL